ncbi:1112_t:CDS:2, partial [Racocetra fulgida]
MDSHYYMRKTNLFLTGKFQSKETKKWKFTAQLQKFRVPNDGCNENEQTDRPMNLQDYYIERLDNHEPRMGTGIW